MEHRLALFLAEGRPRESRGAYVDRANPFLGNSRDLDVRQSTIASQMLHELAPSIEETACV
jgi:hypothetical protein